MKKKTIFFQLALPILLILVTSIDSALAYFTTYAESKGGGVIELGSTSIDYEEFTNWTSHVYINSASNSQPVYVRARAFAGGQYELTYDGEGWTRGDDDDADDFYYYDEILYAGETTNAFLTRIQNVPNDAVPGDSFNVIVIYETIPVQYDADGNPYADWSLVNSGGSAQ